MGASNTYLLNDLDPGSMRIALISPIEAQIGKHQLISVLTELHVTATMLGVAWLATSSVAYYAIRHRQIELHKEWMVRSYVVTFAFVTFRILVELPPMSHFKPIFGTVRAREGGEKPSAISTYPPRSKRKQTTGKPEKS